MHVGKWYSALAERSDAATQPAGHDDRILCELCPRACKLKPDDRGFCFVRKNVGGKMVLDTYGKSTGFCIDPIEKKPLNHFLPGTPVLSFGTAGCNLGCKFCQNWDISKSREVARLSDHASPEAIADAAEKFGCRSVAFTYNDPVIWAEYAIDTAAACHAKDIKTVAVTAGYITPEARGEFFGAMDAANIDLKAFTESFYYKLTGSHLQPVLDTIEYVCNETDCWVELTNLIIPDANDDPDETKRLADWLLDAVGPDVPVHFTAFHPDFRMTDRPRTSHETLIKAYDVARAAGLRYVYVGNVHDVDRQSTYCHQCHRVLIQRDWHQLGQYALNQNLCQHCQAKVPGVFESNPGSRGQKRQRVKIAPPTSEPPTSEPPASEPPTSEPIAISPASENVAISNVQQPRQDMLEPTKLTDAQKERIHQAACQMVCSSVLGTDSAIPMQTLSDLGSQTINGLYVTLKRDGTLRGCCGRQGSAMLLGDSLQDSAGRTVQDPRMAPIAPVELPYLDLSVSLLGPPRPIGVSGDDRIAAIKIGQHGLRIQMGKNAGLLLPSVAVERDWDARQFLDAVCGKAGLPAGAWRSDDAKLMLFDGTYFGGNFIKLDDGAEELCADRVFVSDGDMQVLHGWATDNLQAFLTGATPFYYADGARDCTALGLILKVTHAQSGQTQSWIQLSIRDGVPMQSNLFQMTQQAAQWAAQHGYANDLAGLSVSIAALHQAVHHGACSKSDLRGADSQRRAVVASDGKHWAVQFDSGKPIEQSLQAALEMELFRDGAQLYSMVCQSSDPAISVSLGPRGQSAVTARAPTVASRFYPGDDEQRDAQVDGFLAELPDVAKEKVAAAMVPHAGLRFSGKVATDVWRRIELPKRVLIIGPKHTGGGLDWAVAPHDSWQLSSDVALPGAAGVAAQIAEAVPGMELDALAHQKEHGIEVQLPILARLAPQTEIVAIAMQGGTIERLTAAAKALADWLKQQDDPPLLVISSDMNHYADDAENRRRDRLALDAMKTGDAKRLLDTCESENISMCGQLPAALVLLTLKSMGREIGKDISYDEIAYATSADAGASHERVVGYAGVLLK